MRRKEPKGTPGAGGVRGSREHLGERARWYQRLMSQAAVGSGPWGEGQGAEAEKQSLKFVSLSPVPGVKRLEIL